MIKPGLAFWRKDHPWFVLTDPVPSCGNLTTLDEQCIDDECILTQADYAWIENNHPTAVAFSFAQAYDVQKLDKAIQNGLLELANPDFVPPATLQKVRVVAKTARELSDDLKALL